MKRRDFPPDLKHMKLVRGKIRSRQCGNLVATTWKDKRVVTLLSTNTAPDPEIQAVEERVNGRRKRFVPDDAMKKPEVIKVYNNGMNSADVNY